MGMQQGMPGVMGGMPAGMAGGGAGMAGITGMGGMPLSAQDQAALLSHQNMAMGGLDRRGQVPPGAGRHPGMAPGMHPVQQHMGSTVQIPPQGNQIVKVDEENDGENRSLSWVTRLS